VVPEDITVAPPIALSAATEDCDIVARNDEDQDAAGAKVALCAAKECSPDQQGNDVEHRNAEDRVKTEPGPLKLSICQDGDADPATPAFVDGPFPNSVRKAVISVFSLQLPGGIDEHQ